MEVEFQFEAWERENGEDPSHREDMRDVYIQTRQQHTKRQEGRRPFFLGYQIETYRDTDNEVVTEVTLLSETVKVFGKFKDPKAKAPNKAAW